MSEIQELDESEMTAEEMMALHLMELIEAYETDDASDASFHLEVFTVDGRRHCLPYVEHSHGAVVLMDDSRPHPAPRIISSCGTLPRANSELNQRCASNTMPSATPVAKPCGEVCVHRPCRPHTPAVTAVPLMK
jgi:hypothetical protein